MYILLLSKKYLFTFPNFNFATLIKLTVLIIELSVFLNPLLRLT